MRSAKHILPTVFLVLCAVAPAQAWFFSSSKPGPLAPAIAAHTAGRYAEAAALCQALVAKNLSSKDKELAYWYLGDSYRKAGKPDRALTVLQLGVQLYPENFNLQISLADLYYSALLYTQAKRQYEDMLDPLPDDESLLPQLYSGVARTYEAMGYLTRAAEYYRKALEAPQAGPELSMNYARCLFKQRKYSEAIAAAEKALLQSPGDTELLFLLAKINYETGLKETATNTLLSALEKTPERDDMRLNLSLWLNSMGRHEQAAKQAETVYLRQPDQAQAQFALGLALLKLPGQRERAIELFRSAAAAYIYSPFTAKAAQQLLDLAQQKTKH